MYDIRSLYPGPEFSRIQDDAYSDWTNSQSTDPSDSSFVQQLESKYGITLSGQYYYIENNGNPGDLSPVVDFRSNGPTAGDPNAFVVGEVTGQIPPPDGNTNIYWQEMTAVSGQLASTIFRVYTNAGTRAVGSETVSISRPATVVRN